MSAPAILTGLSDGETALVIGVPMILAMHLAANRFLATEDGTEKGKILIASGLAILAVVTGASYLCENSEKGFCHAIPRQDKLFSF